MIISVDLQNVFDKIQIPLLDQKKKKQKIKNGNDILQPDKISEKHL